MQHLNLSIYQYPLTLLFNLFFGELVGRVKESAYSPFKVILSFSVEIEMFSPQNLLDFVGFMQMTC